ncbi:MAG: hypothetical protein IKS39_09235 [Clostridia bacterium]|nr:hypothetical protein [Clostridia bacterium]
MIKRIAAVICTLLLLLTASCGAPEQKIIYKDTLIIENNESTFEGARERFRAVLESLTTRVFLLEDSHNKALEQENPDSYFLDPNYIPRAFDPFNIASLEITDKIDDAVDAQNAPEIFESEAEGAGVIFDRKDDGYTLKFMTETLTKIYDASYDADTDSLRFVFSEKTPPQDKDVEFLEFIKTEDNSYAIQSNKARCFITFDEDGRIVSFRYAELKTGEYTLEESIFKASAASLMTFKTEISNGKKSDYDNIREYNEGVLTHIETSEGTVNEIQIYSDIYASVFVYD